MAATATHLAPGRLSKKGFSELLDKYPALIESVSSAKPDRIAKSGQESLAALDNFRYGDAPAAFQQGSSNRLEMELADVTRLVQWKLRHGKFRPTLMKLVTSNEPSVVKATVKDAMKVYQDKKDLHETLAVLTKLRGIGPATASLLLSVHDPEKVMFFSDEAFYWLCCEGKVVSIKYDKKEYARLQSEAQKLMQMLDVSAMDLEKVAYVVFKQPDASPSSSTSKPSKAASSKAASKKPAPTATATAEKRKKGPGEDDEGQKKVQKMASTTSTRRSRRGAAAKSAQNS